MTRRLTDKVRHRLAAETGIRARPWGGRLSVGLVYPNTYHQAMSNLGFQTVFRLLNEREDTLCERFVLPDREDLEEHRRTKTPLFSLDSGRPLAEFDLVAFSISFENDFVHLPILFDLARLPLFREERSARHPLVLCGGVCAFLNPEPLAEIMDLFAVGEGEVLLPPLVEALLQPGQDRQELLETLAGLPGIYVPSFYEVVSHPDGTVAEYRTRPPAPPRVRRQWLADLSGIATSSAVLTGETEFGDMYLTEVSRGCSRGCRFCAAGFIYLPERERSLELLTAEACGGLTQRQKIGLVGAAVSDYSRSEELNREILAAGGKLSVASLRIDALSEAEAEALHASGHRTVALAPEAGSQRMRDLINKNLDEEQILAAAEILARVGIANLKLYFLIGLPGEEEEDVLEICRLGEQIRDLWLAAGRERGKVGNVTLSVNPFIPKPFTPMQWCAMEAERGLKRKIALLRGKLEREPHLALQVEPLRSALLQAFLSRGDRQIAACLPLLAGGADLKRACRETGLDPDFYLTRTRAPEEVFPWEIIDSGVTRDYLWREFRKGMRGETTPRCAPGCRRCGVCG